MSERGSRDPALFEDLAMAELDLILTTQCLAELICNCNSLLSSLLMLADPPTSRGSSSQRSGACDVDPHKCFILHSQAGFPFHLLTNISPRRCIDAVYTFEYFAVEGGEKKILDLAVRGELVPISIYPRCTPRIKQKLDMATQMFDCDREVA